MEILVHFVVPAVVGVFIGIASGLLGIGGGTVMVPIFRLAFGMSATMSTATSLFAIIPTSISGVVSHLKGKTCIPALGIAAGIGGALMSPLGVWLAQISPDWLVMFAAALIIGYSAINMFRKAIKLRPACQPAAKADAAAKDRSACQPSGAADAAAKDRSACQPSGAADAAGAADTSSCGSKPSLRAEARGVGLSPQSEASAVPSLTSSGDPASASTCGSAAASPRISGTGETLADASATCDVEASTCGSAAAAASVPEVSLSRKQLLIGGCIGLVAGLASGYVGVGGGFIMVPLMLSLLGIPMRKASGTSLIAVMILAIPGVIEQAFWGNINYLAGIAVVIGTIPGAVIGARLVTKVPERALRFIFGGFLVVAAVMLAVNELGVLG